MLFLGSSSPEPIALGSVIGYACCCDSLPFPWMIMYSLIVLHCTDSHPTTQVNLWLLPCGRQLRVMSTLTFP
jgi:hypothetical protein